MKSDRSRRDVKRNCVFHKDIGHNTEMCVAPRDEIEWFMKARHFKEFVDEPRHQIEKNDLVSGVQKR